ncbi:hypothetical protein [Hymenobacter lucidus]|uniref:Uncharacterized protein n=1 Tax=Hymenobacter lucidus TaxID=2880930 RepID=A0ABS8AQY0_9BACT|nr:hypothetical protein [Hymenobacter lucidus]MCB2408625.1 hypothetical protein [Hymenobacter lucidus]
MYSALSDKSDAIQQAVWQLTAKLGNTYFDIVDYWTDDADAIGIAHPDNHGILAYISTCYLKESGGYYVALKLPKYHSSFPYKDMRSHDVQSINGLAAIMLMHFNMGHIANSRCA